MTSLDLINAATEYVELNDIKHRIEKGKGKERGGT
jgi:uncharacterized LabA/DUF88 family protein